MEWTLGDKTFNIFIYPDDIRAEDYTLQVSTDSGVVHLDPGPSYTYRGWNLDDPSREVRLSITPTYITGFMTDVNGTEWFLQPVSDFGVLGHAASLLYSSQDVIETQERSCGTTDTIEMGGDESYTPEEADHSRSAACKEAEVAIAADYSMYTKYGSNVQALAQHLLDIKNVMAPNYGIYNVQFKVKTTYVETSSGQAGWSTSTDPGVLLDSYCCWAGTGSSTQLNCSGSNGFGVNHDVGEIWSNRDFTGSTIGIAWISSICNTMFRYSANQHFTSNLQQLRVLIGHETGHNFGANHDANGSPYIMAPAVDGAATTWSPASQTAINANLGSYSCMGACGSGGGGGNCVSNLTVTPGSATGTKEADNLIATSGTINLSATTMYNAPVVQITSAFTVPSGITFEIRSTGCDP
ncbi:MAG: hypothetical protein IPL46_30780 [Saprospiraceae bacterium]|nr:hypothetical protein [Saprospiraceae bacterium]